MDLGLLQKNVAEMIVVSECTIYNWENSGSQPAVQYMPGIIDFLGYVPLECPGDILGRLAYFKKIKGLTFPVLGQVTGRDPEQLWDWLSCQKRPYRRNLECINQLLAKHGLNVV